MPDYAECDHFVNADLIASGLSPFSPGTVGIRAARLMLEQIDELAKRRLDFGFETTLSGKSHLRLLRKLKKQRYSIHLFFLWVSSVQLACDRIATRVREGGHSVPSSVVRRRFSRGVRNPFDHYLPLMDYWIIFDNSTDEPRVIAVEETARRRIVDAELFAAISGKG